LETLPILSNRTANENNNDYGISNDQANLTFHLSQPVHTSGHEEWWDVEDNCFVNADLLFLPLLEQDKYRPSHSRFKDLGQDQQEDEPQGQEQ
jgi:hypothetical protein